MAATVATPLEKQFSAIAGIDDMTSTSSLGRRRSSSSSRSTGTSTPRRRTSSGDRADDAGACRGIIPPEYQKTNPADAPILTFALTSNEVPLSHLDEFGETTLAQRLSMVGGVAQVLVYGAQKYAVRLQLDPGQLATRGIALEDVANAIIAQNVNMPTGVLYGPRTALTVQATGQLENAAQFRDVIVAYRNGAPVHLEEIGRITDDVQNNKTASWYNGERSIVLAIQRQPGTNTVEVASKVKAALGRLAAEIPPAVQVDTLYDRSATIKASVDDVTFTLELTLVLVVLVIFLFLRNWSATIIPSLALPMAIIGTFSVMYLLNYSLDNLSLMALTLAVGFVVDDAIVMLENIVRHLEMGKTKMQAAVDGAAEVGFTILSMTFSLAAVFIPFLFMGGIIGKLFHEFAVTIGVAILVSGFVSLTLTPMLVEPVPQIGSRQGARPPVPGDGALLRRVARPLRADARLGDGATSAHARVLVRDPGGDGVPVLVHAQGALPDRRHRAAARHDRSGRRRVVRRARRAPAGGRGSHHEGSRRSVGHVVGGHDRRGQPRAAHDRSQADRRA